MHKSVEKLSQIRLVGISVRTSNLKEMNPTTAKIGATVQQFFSEQMPDQIRNRINPNATYCAYTDYESDMTGDYTFFVGQEVSSFEQLKTGFETLTIPQQAYVKCTNSKPAAMPDVCINMWQEIWAMNESDFGSKRSYQADFEIYDERSLDPQNTVLDIYVGVEG